MDESVQNLLFTGNLGKNLIHIHIFQQTFGSCTNIYIYIYIDDSGDLNRKLSPYTFSALSLCTAWQNISELRRQPSLDLNVQHVDYSFAPLEDSVSISRLADVKHGGRVQYAPTVYIYIYPQLLNVIHHIRRQFRFLSLHLWYIYIYRRRCKQSTSNTSMPFQTVQEN